ncbi:MAG: 30S ribosomal protein S5 [Nanoarchaeota archaeon]|nr:30S ribosomal protein S5 [Nanoarchaeota archaeon]
MTVAEIEEIAKVQPKTDLWVPKTEIGRKVASGEINDINQILDNGFVILEKGIVEALLPNIESDLLLIGRAKGKFGGGKKRIFRQTQKKTKEGNKPRFATLAVVGNKQGIIGLGYGKSKETVPAREKAVRNAKFNIFKIRRGCGSWECGCGEAHSLPFVIEGKSGSSIIRLIPAPKGTGLRVDKEVAKILALAGIKDVWSKTFGQSKTKMNLLKATEDALRKLMKTKLQDVHYQRLSVVEGATGSEKAEVVENGQN